MEHNIDIERINFIVPAGGKIKVNHKTRSTNGQIIGICLQSHSGDTTLVGSEMIMSIDKEEVFPAGFDPSLISFSQRTPVNSRFYNYVNRPINQSDIDIEFIDNVDALGGEYSILLKCTSYA